MVRATAFLLSCALRGEAQIRVMAPEQLVRQFDATNGRIDGSTATFGAPFYGDRMVGRIVWGEPKKEAHCKAEDYEVPVPDDSPFKNSEGAPKRLIHIVMVRRGLCSFVRKVKVASEKGAHAVIIVDRENSTLKPRDIRRIIVADDGYGSTIEVPSILISKEEGERLIQASKTTNNQVIIELAWDVPTNHVVVMDLWMSSGSVRTQQFLKDFSPKRKALNEAVKFVPHFHVFSMQQDYNDLCTNSTAQFCAEDPDGSGPITGKMVLAEDVRQLCIHDLTKVYRTDLDGTGDPSMRGTRTLEYAAKYWDYVERMLASCPLEGADPARRFGTACSENLMKMVGINIRDVNNCMSTTQDEKLLKERGNTAWSPRALRINGWRYTGTLDADLVTRAICSGFTKPEPRACKDLLEPVNPFKLQKTTSSGVSFQTFVTVLFIVCGITLTALCLYKRSLTRHIHSTLREEVMLEVQAQMDTYKQLAGGR